MNVRKWFSLLYISLVCALIWYVSYTFMGFSSTIKNPDTNQPTDQTTQNANEYTAEKLSAFTGKNGQPAYIAVDGVVYDVTALPLWANGDHHGMVAGMDLTALFAKSPHTASILDRAVVVGTYVASTSGTSPDTPNSTVFTLDQLSQYNGQNGQAAYVAVNGIVYDVTSLRQWSDGSHYMGIVAGTDITLSMPNSPHTFDILNRATVVGTLAGDTPKVTADQLTGKGDDD